MKPEEAVDYIESILAGCSPYIQKQARRKVLEAMDIIGNDVQKNKPKEEIKDE